MELGANVESVFHNLPLSFQVTISTQAGPLVLHLFIKFKPYLMISDKLIRGIVWVNRDVDSLPIEP